MASNTILAVNKVGVPTPLGGHRLGRLSVLSEYPTGGERPLHNDGGPVSALRGTATLERSGDAIHGSCQSSFALLEGQIVEVVETVSTEDTSLPNRDPDGFLTS